MKDLHSKNYYELLGVAREATKKEIKEAYKSIALVYHPDSNFFDEIIADENSDNSPEQDIFKHLTAAYNTLMDAAQRSEYDESLPPELPGWDAEKPDIIGRKISAYNPAKPGNCGATSAAFGVFGSRDLDEELGDEPVDPTITQSMENILYQQRESFWDKILSAIGVR